MRTIRSPTCVDAGVVRTIAAVLDDALDSPRTVSATGPPPLLALSYVTGAQVVTHTEKRSTLIVFDTLDVPHTAPGAMACVAVVSQVTVRAAAVTGIACAAENVARFVPIIHQP